MLLLRPTLFGWALSFLGAAITHRVFLFSAFAMQLCRYSEFAFGLILYCSLKNETNFVAVAHGIEYNLWRFYVTTRVL